ncbi:MAG: TetR/AcrR family transcriptional regulator [Propionibacteriaceae bacterium]|nr:TetR/AcrR family transcriptional regulator [Propionibacteriaceae bacterium]
MNKPGRRGPYRKTNQRRAEIIQAALAQYATSDAGGPTLKAIAEHVGIAESALLYHFGSREELFWAIVRARDEQDRFAERGKLLDDSDFKKLGAMIAHNAETPGLVKLFLEFAVAATSPTHPAHEYLRGRYADMLQTLSAGLQHAKGMEPERADWLARVLLAATDGLQIQWLLNGETDMRKDLERLIDLALDKATAN